MSSFLHACKDWFQSEYRGRYLSIILRDFISYNPQILNSIIPKKELIRTILSRSLQIETEYLLPHLNRRADIAILDRNTRELLLLIEVKNQDEKNPRNHAQLTDYIKFISKKENKKVVFCILSKNSLPDQDLKFISKQSRKKEVFFCRLSDVYKRLLKMKETPYIRLLLDFISEEAVIMKENIDEKALKYLILRGCNVRQFNSMGKTHGTDTLIDSVNLLQTLINNTMKLGELFHDDIGKYNSRYKQRPTTNYAFFPIIDEKKAVFDKITKKITVELNEDYFVDNAKICTGQLYIYNYYNIKEMKVIKNKEKEGRWRGGIEFGFSLELEPAKTVKKFKINKYLYAQIRLVLSAGESPITVYHSISIRKFNEIEVFEKLLEKFVDCFNEIDQDYSIELKKYHKTIRSQLSILKKRIKKLNDKPKIKRAA